MSAGRFQKGLSIAVVASIALAIVVSYLLPEPEGGGLPSVSSNRPEGRRALFLVLQRLGWTPEAWRKPPGALPHGAHALWCFSAPGTGPLAHEDDAAPGAGSESADEKTARGPSPARHGLHDRENYRAFVEGGGTIVLEWNQRTRDFLRDDVGLAGLAAFEVKNPSGATSSHLVRTGDGKELAVPWRANATLPQAMCDSLALPLWTTAQADARPDVLAATIDVGAGRVVLLGDLSFTANEHLGEDQSAALALRLLDEQGEPQRILFDEYALGLWEPQTALGLAFSDARLWVTLHVCALLACLAWIAGWARAFPRDPPPLEVVSPLARARGLANVLARARRWSELARFARRGELERLRRRARLLRRRSDDGGEGGREALARDLELAAERLGRGGDVARWRAAFADRRITGEAQLSKLLAELDELVDGAAIEAGARPAAGARSRTLEAR